MWPFVRLTCWQSKRIHKERKLDNDDKWQDIKVEKKRFGFKYDAKDLLLTTETDKTPRWYTCKTRWQAESVHFGISD